MDQKQFMRLVSRSQTGDRMAQEELIATVQNSIYFHCYKMIGDRESAMDLTQEVLLAMITQLPSLHKLTSFRPWLLRILYNRCKNHLIRGHKECQIPEIAEGSSILDIQADEDWQSMPDLVLDNAETTRILRELINHLPIEQRMCVILYYYDELKISEIASVLSIPNNTVKSRLHYARKALKEGILDYIGRNGRFFGFALGPVLVPFLRSEAEACTLPTMAKSAVTVSSLSTTSTIVWKIAICAVVLGVTAGGIWTIQDLRWTKPPEETEQQESGEIHSWNLSNADTMESWLENHQQFIDSLDIAGDPPQVDIGKGWYDEFGRLHLEYRTYASYTSVLQEVVLEADNDQWSIYHNGPAEGLYADGMPGENLLSTVALQEIEAWLCDGNNGMPLYVLTSDFRTPADLSLLDVFQDGYCPNGMPVLLSETEQLELLGRTSDAEVTCATIPEMDQVLLDLAGISLSETDGYGLELFQQQGERYYLEHIPKTLFQPHLLLGWSQDDGTVCVQYEKNKDTYELCLKPAEDGWQFVSHRPVWQLKEVNEEALAEPLKLSESFVISEVLLPPELALIQQPFTFDTPQDLSSDQLLTLFLLWTDYDHLETCQENDGNFYFREPMIRSTLNRYFKEYTFDIKQCRNYDPTHQAVVLGNASGFGGDRGMRIIETHAEGRVVTYIVEFYDLYAGEDSPALQCKSYTIEYYLGGWYYLSVQNLSS